jgi:hypothetical protein
MRLSFSRTLLLLPLAGVLIAASSGPVSQGYEPVVQIPPPIIGAGSGQAVAAAASGKDKYLLTSFPCKRIVHAGSLTELGFEPGTTNRHTVKYQAVVQKKAGNGQWAEAIFDTDYVTHPKWRKTFTVTEFSPKNPSGDGSIAQGYSFDIWFAPGTFRVVLAHKGTTSTTTPLWDTDESDEVTCP